MPVSLTAGMLSLFLYVSAPTQVAMGGILEDLPARRDLTLQEFLQLVVENNESLQAKVLDVEIARRKGKATYGQFEPELFGGYSREANKRENTAEQARSQLTGRFEEQNNIYQAGIESLVPTGARIRLGYTLRDLKNNLQGSSTLFGTLGGTNGEFQSFFGVSVSQPLLKNAWESATMAEIRVAALNSAVAFQEYRRQMMIVISTAEASYWNLYLAQEQVNTFRESVSLADTVLRDAREKMQAGKGTELEILEAQSAMGLRKSRLNEAIQKLYEAANQVTTLYGASPTLTNVMVHAVDQPELVNTDLSFFDTWRTAFDYNPDYLAQRQRCTIEGVRLAYANNQMLPQLDLKGSYGLNGLGTTPGESWDDIQHTGFPSWSLGFELRIPLAGNIKARNERAAAQLSQKRALIDLKSLENQIANAAHTAIQKIRSKEESVPDAESVVSYVTNLLQSEMTRLEAGKIESRRVLEVEAALLEARSTLTETMVNYRRALLEKELIEGALLRNRGLEMTRNELQVRTARLVSGGSVSAEDFQNTLQQLSELYGGTNRVAEPNARFAEPQDLELKNMLRQRMLELDETPTAEPPKK